MPKNLSTIRECDIEYSLEEPLENFTNGRPRMEPKNSLSEVVTQGKWRDKERQAFKELENKVRKCHNTIFLAQLYVFL